MTEQTQPTRRQWPIKLLVRQLPRLPLFLPSAFNCSLLPILWQLQAQPSLSLNVATLPHKSSKPSVDIRHLFGLISRLPGLLYGFFLCFSVFLVFSYRYFLRF